MAATIKFLLKLPDIIGILYKFLLSLFHVENKPTRGCGQNWIHYFGVFVAT
jgi:hypothetical protein